MPAAIPVAATVGGGLLGDIFQNGQNKSNQQAATNAQTGARQNDAAALQTALGNLQQYMAANPSPGSQYGNVKGPASLYGNQTSVNSPTSSVNGGPTPQMMQQMIGKILAAGSTASPLPIGAQSLTGALQPQTQQNGVPQGRVGYGGTRIALPGAAQ